MSIRCFFGCHDYEPFGDGVKVLDIIERSAKLKADALYMKDFEREIYSHLKAKVMSTYFGDMDMKEFMLEHSKIRDEVCLRCGKIKTNIQKSRVVADSQAVFAGMTIKMREDRAAKAKRMLVFMAEDKNKCI